MRGFLTAAVKTPSLVMAGLVPATHVFATAGLKTWVRGSSPAMTSERVLKVSELTPRYGGRALGKRACCRKDFV